MLHYLFCIITGNVADASDKSGGLGATLTDLAQTSELSIAQNVETASQNGKVRNAVWSHLPRDRGTGRHPGRASEA